jgi:uncharacterized protein with PIN domain
LRFVADAHFGGLARFLRMLGFDTVHSNALAAKRSAGSRRTRGASCSRAIASCSSAGR